MALMTFCNYVYVVSFLMETDANTFVHQLHSPANDLPRPPVTHWITLIWPFNFDVKHIPDRLNGGPHGLAWQLGGEGEPKSNVKAAQEETIQPNLSEIQVEWQPEQKRDERAYEQRVQLRLVEEYKGRRKELGEFLKDLKQLDGRTMKAMQQICQTTTSYLVSDCVLSRRQKSKDPPAKVLVNTEWRRNATEATH